MALINCPSCNKRMSNKAAQCPHCSAVNSLDTTTLTTIEHIKRSNRLMTQSFLALSLFIAGVMIWFWDGDLAEGVQSMIAIACFSLGFIGYLITRIQIVLHKRKKV